MRKKLPNIDYSQVMHPDDKKTVDWLNGLQVPYMSKWDFIREIAKHPLDHNLKTWYEIFKSDLKYYTFKEFLAATTSKYQEAYNEVENHLTSSLRTPRNINLTIFLGKNAKNRAFLV